MDNKDCGVVRKDQCQGRQTTRGGPLTDVEGGRKVAAMAGQDKEEQSLTELYNFHFPTLPLSHFAWSVRPRP